MEDRFQWSTTIGEKIDWTTHGRLLTDLHFYQPKFIIKLIHERSPVRGMSYNLSPSKVCPICKKTQETIDHLH
eukprot:12133781-Ditylum_brightwellii.AAC.1